jgi:FXSXX-COOH protein
MAEDYEVMPWLNGELSPVVRGCRRKIMGEDVSDRSLLDVSGLSMRDLLDESALARALRRILASSAEGPSNSFSASI